MFLTISSFIIGLTFGSLISLISHRLPLYQDIFIKRSQCPKCNHKLGIKDLIPVLSWVFSQGKCNYCNKNISIRYPLIEIFTGFVFSLTISFFGLTNIGFLFVFLVILLTIITIIDFEHYIIPDSLQVIFLIVAIIWAYIFKHSVMLLVVNLLIGFFSAFFISLSFKYIRNKDGLGFGDVKFIAIATIFIGYQNLVIFYLFSGIFGVINGIVWQIFLKKKIYPFAPSLCMSFFLCLIIPYFFDNSESRDMKILDILVFNLFG